MKAINIILGEEKLEYECLQLKGLIKLSLLAIIITFQQQILQQFWAN